VLRRKRCWKACFTFLGGAFGTSGTVGKCKSKGQSTAE
ncbi:hypothetical protein Tco_0634256, partial [Tanacetum coccineum]